MFKKILFAVVAFFSLTSIAQTGTASPYSFYGIGEIKFKGTNENRAMGGIGIVSDSIHLNLQNPASLSSLKLTTFTVGGTFTPSKLKNATETQNTQRTSLDYLAMSFPAKKFGISLGLIPYSAVGYKLSSTTSNTFSRNFGNGEINRVFAGVGYQVLPKLSVGAEFYYNFGNLITSASEYKNEVQYGSRELNAFHIEGASFNLGLNYKTKIEKLDFVSSATFAPNAKLKSEKSRVISTVSLGSSGEDIAVASSSEVVTNFNIKHPSKFTFGSGIGKDKKWFVGFESTFMSKADFGISYTTNAKFEASNKISLGGYYIPKYNSFGNYLNKIVYRAGFRHENTGLVINGESIKDTGVSFGLGCPISGQFSNLNFGFEYGKRGTVVSGLAQENYMNFTVGISFNDRWFVKRKYD